MQGHSGSGQHCTRAKPGRVASGQIKSSNLLERVSLPVPRNYPRRPTPKPFAIPITTITRTNLGLQCPMSGKTSIANFISESINTEEAGPPKPTQGVRIVEFELSNINVNDKVYNNDIELWDCSGDHRFESCWPALRVGVHGVILVCSPSTANAATREMELLYNYFVSQPKLTTKQCVLFYNCTEDQDDLESLNLSSTFSKVSQVAINLKTGGNRLKIDFSNFVISILQSINRVN